MTSSAFSPTVLTLPASAAGSGQGELNLITNPTATTDTTGWLAGAGATLGRGTGGGPLNPTVSTYFTTINTAGAESSTSGAYDVLTLPSGMQNRKLKVEFYFTSPASDTFKVSVYKGSTRVPLSTDSAGSTSLPASTTGKFTAYFDTDSSGTWTVSITRTAGTGVTPLQFTNVVVGPGIQPQGAVVGEWQSYTPVLRGDTTNPTTSVASGKWRRVGANLEADIAFTITAAGSGVYSITLPSGLSVDYSAMGSISTDAGIGSGGGYFSTNAAATRLELVAGFNSGVANVNKIILYKYNAGALASSDVVGASSILFAHVTVPIAEWAGSGTVQLAQNDVEYAYNTSTTDADDLISFGYGPGGTSFPTVTAQRAKRIRFQTPIQSTDTFTVEFQKNGDWVPLSGTAAVTITQPFTAQAATTFGVGIDPVNSTDIDVYFGAYRLATGATYGAAGTSWTGMSIYKWRVRKSSAGAAVGVGLVAKDSAGLLPAYNSNLDDATATRLGLKQYLADKAGGANDIAYFGGNKATLTASDNVTVAISSVTRAVLIPYQTQDGNWRLKFNINFVLPSATRTTASVFINGVTSATYNQATSSSAVTSTATNIWSLCYASTNPVRIQSLHASAATTEYIYSGDIELASKPTWAYS